MPNHKQIYRILCMILSITLTILMLAVSGCYGDNDGNSNDDARRTPSASPNASPSTAANVARITYPASNMVIEVEDGNRVALSVEVSTSVYHYKWQIKVGNGVWTDIDSEYAEGRQYTTAPLSAANDGDQYRCIVTAPTYTADGKMSSDSVTLTSPVFTIEIVDAASVSPGASPSPTARPRPSPTPTSHRHDWVDETTTQPVYEDITYYSYACNGCDFTTSDLTAMEAHASEYDGRAGHGGYQSNVQIDLKTTPVYGFACNNCDFTTQDQSEMEIHSSDCPAHDICWQNALTCTTCAFAHYESEEDWEANHLTYFEDHTYVISAYVCIQCGEAFADEAGWNAHTAQYPGGFQENVQIGTQETPIYGYACNGCDFTTQSLSAMQAHDEANRPHEDHGGYRTIETVVQEQTGTETVKTGKKICTICKAKR